MDATIPKYLLVEDHIRQQIKQRKITSKLPGERILAKELGFSYMTIRKAIENLVNEGLLYKVPTKGTYVAERSSTKAKTRTIGYFLDSRIAGGLSSPYYSMIFAALEKVAAINNYSLVYFTDSNDSNFQQTLNKLDGVIVSCFLRIEAQIQEIKKSVPVVAIDNSASDMAIPSVIIDNFNALVDCVDYLCANNHREIGFMTGLEDSDVGKNRYEGYKSGLAKQGIEVKQELIFRGNYTFGSGVSGVDYFLTLENKPTAIICANDSMALGAKSRLHQLGLDVPGDISIIGFDDIDVASQVVPALTTVAVPIDEIASCAYTMLMDLIDGKTLASSHVALATRLVVRDSTQDLKDKHRAA